MDFKPMTMERKARNANSTFATGGGAYSADTFVVKIPPIANLQKR